MAGPDGYPQHRGGVVDGEKGLYYVGLPFQTRLASGLIGGVGEDARYVAGEIASRLAKTPAHLHPAAEVELAVG